MRHVSKGHRDEPPVLLVKWYDVTRWLLDRVDAFPKNQRFTPLEIFHVLRLCPAQ
jgi:hypothetical protein